MIRCLIVDDSPTFRALLSDLLGRDPELKIVGQAADGDEAVNLAMALRPDVITMDVRMPRKDGLAALQEIMARAPAPVIVVCAADDERGLDVSYQALRLGAVDVLAKPSHPDPLRLAAQAEAIRAAVRAVGWRARAEQMPRPISRGGTAARPRTGKNSATMRAVRSPAAARPMPKVVAIAASTGGPAALAQVLSELPADFPAPILIVQHVLEGFGAGLVRWLASQCVLKVELAGDRKSLKPGTAILAPDDRHLMVSVGRSRLDAGPPVGGHRPSGTLLLASVAKEFGEHAAGVVLTGMGADGAEGLKALRARGALTIAQGPQSSVVYGMPKVAVESGAAEHVVELDEMAGTLLKSVGLPADASRGENRRRLLLVDDAETILMLERQILEGSYDLLFARNGREALDQARKHKPDVVVMDYTMPVMDGGTTLRELKADAKTRSIPVIIVTSERDPNILGSVRAAGCHSLLSKPVERPQLVEAVRKALGRD
jgi:two-component system chemotaxis response regulator CheB